MNALAVVSPSVSIVNQRPVTTSKAVAEFFNKQHKDVLRKVESLIADLDREWGQRNFTHTPYIDPQNGQQYPAYEITRDGFTLLAMGFTGKRALEWKIKYIDAFNAMEKELHQTALPRQYPGDKLTPAQLRTLQEAVAQRTEGMTDKARAAASPNCGARSSRTFMCRVIANCRPKITTPRSA